MHVMLTFEKKEKVCFLNRMRYIEGSLMKSSGNISRTHENCWFEKKVDFKGKITEKDVKVIIYYINIS